MRVEDVVAKQLESEGYLVMRTYKKGTPDLLAFKPEHAQYLLAVEVKGPGDSARKHQIGVIDRLKAKGVDAAFRYVSELELREGRETFEIYDSKSRQYIRFSRCQNCGSRNTEPRTEPYAHLFCLGCLNKSV